MVVIRLLRSLQERLVRGKQACDQLLGWNLLRRTWLELLLGWGRLLARKVVWEYGLLDAHIAQGRIELLAVRSQLEPLLHRVLFSLVEMALVWSLRTQELTMLLPRKLLSPWLYLITVPCTVWTIIFVFACLCSLSSFKLRLLFPIPALLLSFPLLLFKELGSEDLVVVV